MQTTSLAGLTSSMELIFNDCSVDGQFQDLTTFQVAIERVMTIRQAAQRFGRRLQCHRNVSSAQVMPGFIMQRAVQTLEMNKRRVVMQWLNQLGPFWDKSQQHSSDDWLECNGEPVTDTAIGEAAHCRSLGLDRRLVSMDPSAWLSSPLSVEFEIGPVRQVDVLNYWHVKTVQDALAAAPIPIQSWDDLAATARVRFPDLTFSRNSFAPLRGHPFGRSPAERLLSLLTVLHDFKNCFNEQGQRTSEGHEISQQHFTGERAWFSDSSNTEKSQFKSELTFPHPTRAGEKLFCTWHGKVRTPQLRVHFSWPIRADEPLYVVYVGPKITKR